MDQPKKKTRRRARAWSIKGILEYLQDQGRPVFQPCTSCGNSEGVWWGFYRLNRATVVRRKRCQHCKRVYNAARLDSRLGEVDNWEARFLLHHQKFYKEWLKTQSAKRTHPG